MYITYYNFCRVYIENPPSQLHKYLNEELPILLSPYAGDDAVSDIHVKMVKEVRVNDEFYFLQHNDSGFDSRKFYIFDWPYKVSLNIDELAFNNTMNIECENLFGPKKLFVEIIEPLVHLLSIKKQFFFVRASSVIYEGQVYLFPAWASAGKTSLLLQFLTTGGKFLGDNYSILTDSGDVLSYCKRISLADHHLRVFPKFKGDMTIGQKVALLPLNVIESTTKRWGPNLPANVRKGMELLLSVLKAYTKFDIPAAKFHQESLDRHHLDHIIVLLRGNISRPVIVDAKPEEVARRLTMLFIHDSYYFFQQYLCYKFAFPGSLIRIEELIAQYEEGLVRIFRNLNLRRLAYLYLPNTADNSTYSNIMKLIINKGS